MIGVFGYSDEDGTEAASYDGKLDDDEIRDRVEHVTGLVEELTAQRAEERIGERRRGARRERRRTATAEGRAAHQGPEVDGTTRLAGCRPAPAVGDLVARRRGRHRRASTWSRSRRMTDASRATEAAPSATGTCPTR